MSKLDLIIGPMFAGKTTFLINKIKELKNNNNKFIILKSSLDIRYNIDKITSHDNINENCIPINNLIEFTDVNQYDTILIDEAQFITNLKKCILEWLDIYNIHIIICGLDGDFQKNKIGEILDLIPYADTCIKLNSKCHYCNNNAPFTHRINNDKNIILIGSKDYYIPLCRFHYKIYNI